MFRISKATGTLVDSPTKLAINPANARMEHFDVVLLGAGPAGTTCALALRESGLRVALIDREAFPRDKICGDAIGGRAERVLREIDPGVADSYRVEDFGIAASGWRLVTPRGRSVTATFVKPGRVVRRVDFDHFLLGQVRSAFPQLNVLTGWNVRTIRRCEKSFELKGPEGSLTTRLLVGCDGANSIVARQLTGRSVDPDHHSGAVRAYYAGIRGIAGSELLEIFLVNGFLPGYCWIFPLPNGMANVGFGMLTRDIARRKIDLKSALDEIIASTPELRERFHSARRIGAVKGFGLPLGGRAIKASGDGFLLCGDAAGLVDPLNGEGIANAMWSAQIAARHILRAFGRSRFDAGSLQAYDDVLNAKLGPELRRKLQLQRLFNRPWLIENLVGLGNRLPWLKERVARRL
jgi:geranylgeranyl reductase family protein